MNYKIATLIDRDLDVTGIKNPEIGQRWYPLAIALSYQEIFPSIKDYVQTIGRQKYILPCYTALVRYGYRSLAYQWFDERKTFYHPIAAANIRKIIFSTKMDEIDSYDMQIKLHGDNEDKTLFLQWKHNYLVYLKYHRE